MPTTLSVESLPHWLQVLLILLGAIVPVASFAASIINAYVRALKAQGAEVPTWMLALAAVANVPALNTDKAIEASKALTTKEKP